MRVLHRDLKAGEIKVRIGNADDLWHLSNLLVPGDRVRASTYRREESKSDKLRPDRAEKVRVTLTIRVDKSEFQAFSDRLRVSGIIVEGPQDLSRHHTLNVGVDDDLTLIKDAWKPHELTRIDEAVEASQRPMVTFLSLDDEEVVVAQLHQYGVHELATIRAPGHGKMFPIGETKDTFFEEVRSKLKATALGEALIVLGPGFTRDAFLRFLRDRDPTFATRTIEHGTSQAGMRGISEALRAGVGAKVFGESRVGFETRLVEEVLEAIATNRPCAYGRAEVGTAVEVGAVETLLVLDSAVRDLEVERLMRDVEAARGRVVLVSHHHEAGARLGGLGGLAALLRYPIR